jgi:hypothetical protein
MRKATWAILIWTGVAGLLVWSIVDRVQQGTMSQQIDPAIQPIVAGLSVVLWLGRRTDGWSVALFAGPAICLLLLSHTRTATVGLLVAAVFAAVPAMVMLYVLLHRYDRFFSERRLVMALLVGLLAGTAVTNVASLRADHTPPANTRALTVIPAGISTGAPVYCPKLEVPVLADIMSYVPGPGFGPFESYQADETVEGGEQLELAGFAIEVLSTPGHSPGHVSYSIADEGALFSGDVLFQGSVGRTDLPGGDWATLARSIAMLLDTLPPETKVFPGHMGLTTLGQERTTNPFLQELPAHR